MTSKKKTSNAFLGQPVTFIPNVISESSTAPPYEDSGVKFQGYYKKNITGNTFELKKQYAFNLSCAKIAAAGCVTSRINIKKKNVYITSIYFSYSNFTADILNGLYYDLYDDSGGLLGSTQQFIAPFTADRMQMVFNPPLRLNGFQIDIANELRFVINDFPAGGGTKVTQINGYTEDL